MPETNQIAENSTTLLNNIWGVQNPAQSQEQQTSAEDTTQQQAQTAATTTQEQSTQQTQPTTPDYNLWVKENFGVDTVEAAKQKWDEVKNFKPEEPKYKTVEELLGDKEEEISKYLSNKQRLTRLSSAQLDNDTVTASEIIKLSMQQKNPELTSDDADFMFNEKFHVSAKPVQDLVNESDEEYNARLSQWQEQSNRVQRQMIIEAKMAKPELEKLKTELKYPEIHTPIQTTNEPTPEELATLQSIRDGYVATLNQDYKKFEGFNAQYKDEEVEYAVPYTVSDEEKEVLKSELENFDMNAFFDERWFTKEGKPNINQMQSDLYLLKNRDKVFQKIANEAGSQRLLQKIKTAGNINVDGTTQTTFNPQQPSQEKQLYDSIWGVKQN